MRRMVIEYKKVPAIRLFSAQLVAIVPDKDFLGEIMLLWQYVKDNIRYTLDVNDVETLMDPIRTLSYAFGDCDDQATLLATMCESVGHPTKFTAVGFAPGEFSHVYCEAFCQTRGHRRWFALETTEDMPFDWRPPNVVNTMTVRN